MYPAPPQVHSHDSQARQPEAVLWALACLLFGLACFVYSGRVLGIDGQAALATSSNFVRHGSWDMNLLSVTEWLHPPPGGQGFIGPSGDLFAKRAPLLSLLLTPFVWLAVQIPGLMIGPSALMMLPLLYAATGWLMARLALRLGFSLGWALIGSLAWGLGSFALANLADLSAEPLVTLAVTMMVYGAAGPRDSRRDALICGLGLALAAGANLALILLLPLPLLPMFWPLQRRWRTLERAVLVLFPLLLVGLFTLSINQLRSGSPFDSGYHFNQGEGFTMPLAAGLYGILLSPYRGLLWYAPLTLLSLPGYWLSGRRRMPTLMLALSIVLALIFSSWWSWWGGYVWGPRFMLPALPLLTLLALYALRVLWRGPLGRIFGGALLGLGLILQIPGALIHFSFYEADLRQRYGNSAGRFVSDLPDAAVESIADSPLLGQWRFFAQDGTLWPAWGFFEHGALVLMALLLILLGLSWGLILSWRRGRFVRWVGPLALLMGAGMMAYSSWGLRNEGIDLLDDYWLAMAQPQDQLLWMDINAMPLLEMRYRPRAYSMLPDARPDERLSEWLMQRLSSSQAGSWWLVTQQPGANWLEAQLWRSRYASVQALGPYRVLQFADAPDAVSQGLAVRFGDMLLSGWSISQTSDTLFVLLQWEGDILPGSRAFVHVLDAEGQILQQQDRVPQGGYAESRPILDRHLFQLRANQRAQSLRIGWVDAEGRLITPEGPGLEGGATFLLLALDG